MTLGIGVANGTTVARSRGVPSVDSIAAAFESLNALVAAVEKLQSELDAEASHPRRRWVDPLKASAALVGRLLECMKRERVGLSAAVSVREEGRRVLGLLEGEVARRDGVLD